MTNGQHGGYREGAGRKPSGKRKAVFYITEQEEAFLRTELERFRVNQQATASEKVHKEFCTFCGAEKVEKTTKRGTPFMGCPNWQQHKQVKGVSNG